MRDSASEQISLRRMLLAVAVLSLLLTGLTSPAARAAGPPERLTAEQRKDLGQAGELSLPETSSISAGQIAPALEKIKQALEIHERLYPKSEYPDGHPDLATSQTGWASCSRPRGPTARRGAITSGRWRCARPSTPRSGIRRDTPTWPPA